MCNTPESMEVVNKQLLPMPYLVWSPSLDSLGKRSVQYEYRGEHDLPLETVGNSHGLKHGTSHSQHRLVSPIDDTILL
jgi:hypothetical protein